MPTLSPNEHAAIAQIAATISAVVTNANINAVADQCGLRLDGSNKSDRLRDLLMALYCDGRRRGLARDVIVSLFMEAHARSVQGKAPLFYEDTEVVVREARVLSFSLTQIAKAPWRNNLKRRSADPAAPPASSSNGRHTHTSQGTLAAKPKRHEHGLAYIEELLASPVSPQHRGRQLENILHAVLADERLSPAHRIVNPGEELDLSCLIDGQHYIVECKWEKEPVGLPILRDFIGKIETKAVGTFGVLLAMGGFVGDINEKAHRGQRLSCVGLDAMHLMNILEGRTTWAETVRSARTDASRRSRFFTR